MGRCKYDMQLQSASRLRHGEFPHCTRTVDRQQAVKADQLQDTERWAGRYCQPWLAAVAGCLVISQQQAADAKGGRRLLVRSAIMMATRNWGEA
jgi:hypothetical protein